MAAKLDECVAGAKKLSGGVRAFMVLAMGQNPVDGKDLPGCVCACGSKQELAVLYNLVPNIIKKAAALNAMLKIFADDEEENNGK